MKTQRGLTLTRMLVVSFCLFFVALLVFRLIPPYLEYFQIQKIFRSIAAKPEAQNGTQRDAMTAWGHYAIIENINVISWDDIEVKHEGKEVVLSASYTAKVPLFNHVSVLLDFKPTSAER